VHAWESDFVALIIMDGWGLAGSGSDNAVSLADTPNIDALYRKFPVTRLASSGEAVGLPENQMGNSEVGHLNLGAGRIVFQDMLLISRAIEEGTFFQNEVLQGVLQKVREQNSALHLMGLLSDGGVHSHITHLYALLRLARKAGLQKVYIHAILDGRDTPPRSAGEYLQALEREMAALQIGRVASISGRYYSMDRDRRWPRTEKAYRAYVYGEGHRSWSSLAALGDAYHRGETDEFVIPTVICNAADQPTALINTGDGLIFFNFRADRARQISRAFVQNDFQEFERGAAPSFPDYVCFTEYEHDLALPVAFPPHYPQATLGEVLSRAGRRQLRVAETEKYAHVTYFFNGGREEPFPGEERILVPSPHVATYDLQPEMSAEKVTEEVLEALDNYHYDLVVLNYANADMLGHTGKLTAAIKAVETVDREVGRVVARVLEKGGTALVTADHGNAEKMMENGTPHTAHTNNDTPFILVSPRGGYTLPGRGKLADVAPTILRLLGIPVPVEMSGKSLV
jgi:2,3-bisphosphoglycerate-independent phosphoglycerate mutase